MRFSVMFSFGDLPDFLVIVCGALRWSRFPECTPLGTRRVPVLNGYRHSTPLTVALSETIHQ